MAQKCVACGKELPFLSRISPWSLKLCPDCKDECYKGDGKTVDQGVVMDQCPKCKGLKPMRASIFRRIVIQKRRPMELVTKILHCEDCDTFVNVGQEECEITAHG